MIPSYEVSRGELAKHEYDIQRLPHEKQRTNFPRSMKWVILEKNLKGHTLQSH